MGHLLVGIAILRVVETAVWGLDLFPNKDMHEVRLAVPLIGGVVFFLLVSAVFYYMIHAFEIWAGI